jgi:hypothetical protein
MLSDVDLPLPDGPSNTANSTFVKIDIYAARNACTSASPT